MSTSLRLFLAGDVMTGRGIDQALAQSCDPVLHEEWVRDWIEGQFAAAVRDFASPLRRRSQGGWHLRWSATQ